MERKLQKNSSTPFSFLEKLDQYSASVHWKNTSKMSKQYSIFGSLIKRLFISFILFNVMDFGVICRKIPRDETEDLRAAYDGMKVMRQQVEEDLPRQALVDVLQKGHYFQDIFSEHLEPLKIQFGHVCENPKEWEQRFERKDLKNNKHQGKVRWGNKNGEYGEHYWDLNHGQ